MEKREDKMDKKYPMVDLPAESVHGNLKTQPQIVLKNGELELILPVNPRMFSFGVGIGMGLIIPLLIYWAWYKLR